MITASNNPLIERNLPADLYGHSDIRMTADGGKEFSLAHTLGTTVLSIMSGTKPLVLVGALALLLAVAWPVRDEQSPLTRFWLYAALLFLLLHLAGAAVVAVWTLVTGTRKITKLTIREDGLVWNDQHFFPVEHIWSVGYGTTIDEGKASEVYEPLITIELGTRKIVLAEGLDVASATLFKRVFSEDTRRYWHRHN